MQKMEASMEYQHDATLGEGPVWDERDGRLYWVDILSGTLFGYDPVTSRNRAHDLGEHLGAVGLRRLSPAARKRDKTYASEPIVVFCDYAA